MRSPKGQGSLEYLLIIGGGILVAVVIITTVLQLANPCATSGSQLLMAGQTCNTYTVSSPCTTAQLNGVDTTGICSGAGPSDCCWTEGAAKGKQCSLNPTAKAVCATGSGGTSCTDGDYDGYGLAGSTGCSHPEVDCDDTNPAIHPGAIDLCSTSLLDEDCSGTPFTCGAGTTCNVVTNECDPIVNLCTFTVLPDAVSVSTGFKTFDFSFAGSTEAPTGIVSASSSCGLDAQSDDPVLTLPSYATCGTYSSAGKKIVSFALQFPFDPKVCTATGTPAQNWFCVNENCTPGQTRCDPLNPTTIVQTCQTNVDTCIVWNNTQTCTGGQVCSGGVCVTPSVCGDGAITGSETCDDGGTIAGDGCSATCLVEAGFECFGAPSDCYYVVSSCGFSDWALYGTKYTIPLAGITTNTTNDCFTIGQAGTTLNCQDRTITLNKPSSGGVAVRLSASNTTFKNCNLIVNSVYTDSGIYAWGALSNVLVEDNDISNARPGILVNMTGAAANIQISKNRIITVGTTGEAGIIVSTSQSCPTCIIGGGANANTISGTRRGIEVNMAIGVQVLDNIVSSTGTQPVFLVMDSVSNAIIRGNQISGSYTFGSQMGVLEIDGTNNTVQNNFITTNSTGAAAFAFYVAGADNLLTGNNVCGGTNKKLKVTDHQTWNSHGNTCGNNLCYDNGTPLTVCTAALGQCGSTCS